MLGFSSSFSGSVEYEVLVINQVIAFKIKGKFIFSEVQEISSEEEEEEEDEQTNDTETSSSYADSARSTPIPGATPSKKGRPEGMPKKRYQKAGLFSNTYKEEE